jgi:hypothetical protein
MASPVKIYQQEMHGNLGFFATWLPGDPIEIGEVGVLEGGRFRRMSSLKELGIACDLSTGQSAQNVQYTSTQGTKITTSAGATATAVAKAEITIDFSREGAFVFHASGLRWQRLENRSAVAEEVVEAYKKDKWKKGWLLVEALHTAEQATIIVSEDSSAGLVLVASAEAPIAGVSLADPKIGLTVASTQGKIVHIVGGKGLHPLYSCLRLKDPLFGAPSVQPVRGSGVGGEEIPFTRPNIDELLNS